MSITNSSAIRKLRDSLSLSKLQKKVLIGSLLGDGCLTPNVWGKNYRLQIEHGKTQKNLVFWKQDVFSRWVLAAPRYMPKTKSWRFKTISHPELTEFANLFYRNNKKIIPENIEEFLTDPLILAVWIMDDGCLTPRKNGLVINTQSFTLEENERLRKCLSDKFGIKLISIHKDKDRHRLYIRLGSLNILRKIINRYLLKEFLYKLPGPVETCSSQS